MGTPTRPYTGKERKVAYHPIDNNLPFPREGIVPTVRSFVDGYLFGWNRLATTEVAASLIIMKRSPLVRAIFTAVMEPGQETADAFGILAEDLNQFSFDKTLLSSSRLLEAIVKLRAAHLFSGLARTSWKGNYASPEITQLTDSTSSHITQLITTIDALTVDDLFQYVVFSDAYWQLHNEEQAIIDESAARKRNGKSSLIIAVSQEGFQWPASFREVNNQAWVRLRVEWGWKQMQDALTLLPNIQSPEVQTHLLAAFNNNLLASHNMHEEAIPGGYLPLPGIIRLFDFSLGHGNQEVDNLLQEDYPFLSSAKNTTVSFGEFHMPYKNLPMGGIMLLQHLGGRMTSEDFQSLLTNVHEQLNTNSLRTQGWLCSLIILRNEFPSARPHIDTLLAQWEELPGSAKATLLDQEPGKVWMMSSGKVRVTDPTTQLQSVYPLYVSIKAPDATIPQAQEDEIDQQPSSPVTSKDTEIRTREIAVSSTQYLPFIGEIGVLSNAQVTEEVDRAFAQKTYRLNLDRLYDDNDRLLARWRTDRLLYSRLLFAGELLPDQEGMKTAQEMGIRAVYFDEDNVLFVLDHQELPLGIAAKLDGNGNLSVEGMPDTFEGELLHLFLANLALYLKTRKIESLGKSAVFDREFKRAIHSGVKSRPLDPEATGERSIIIQIPNGNKPVHLVAVGEMQK